MVWKYPGVTVRNSITCLQIGMIHGIAAHIESVVERQSVDGRGAVDAGLVAQFVEYSTDELRGVPGVRVRDHP